jgi:hypothetical protein
MRRHGLYDKDIVDIGSGQGDFLRLLCELGDNRGVGIDPSYGGGLEAGRVRFIQDTYSSEHARYPSDFLSCRHVLEHLPDPGGLVGLMRLGASHRSSAVIYVEVPNFEYQLRELAIWDMIYEHCSHFCANSLARVLTRNGFEVMELRESFGGQYLAAEACLGDAPSESLGFRHIEDLAPRLVEDVAAFADLYRGKVETWRRDLNAMASAGQRVVLWGAGSKGVAFLNAVGADELVEYIVDINPRKQGAYVAGTGQRIVAPHELRDYRPGVVVVMNPIYEQEIQSQLRELGVAAETRCA